MGDQTTTTLSVIIPTLNEESSIDQCLRSIPPDSGVEIIVSDGGSTDQTKAITQRHKHVRWLVSPPGRAQQMNHAADAATGDVLLFLHADTTLPRQAIKSIRIAINEGSSMGCFERVFTSNHWLLKRTSRWAGWRARNYFLAFGDQAIFMKKTLFHQIGGYTEMPQFEDMDLTRRARKHGNWSVLTPPILTDARRFHPSPCRRIISDAIKTALWILRQKK